MSLECPANLVEPGDGAQETISDKMIHVLKSFEHVLNMSKAVVRKQVKTVMCRPAKLEM